MTNRVAFILTLSFSFLFGVDTPKVIETLFQTTTGIQFNAEVFHQNQLIKKRLQESYKQARKAKGIPKPDGKSVHISKKKGSEPLGKHFQKLESIKADLNIKNFFGDFNSKSAHKKETAKADYLTRRNEMKQKRAFAPKKQNSMIPHGNDMSSYLTGYRTHQTENNGRPTVQNIRNRETISFFDYHDVHANVSNWNTTNATFVVETEAGPEAGEDALQWVELGETGADRSKVGWTFYPYIDLSGVWESVGMSDHWFRIEIKTDYSGDLKVYFSDGPGKYQTLTVTVQGTGLWETYEFPLSDTSPTTGANATDFNTSEIYSLSIQDFNHEEGRTFDIGVIEIYSPADDGIFIEGIVRDFSGNPIAGVDLNAEIQIGGGNGATTDEGGYYHIDLDSPGLYRVDVWPIDGYWDDVTMVEVWEGGTQYDFILGHTEETALLEIQTMFEDNGDNVPFAELQSPQSPQGMHNTMSVADWNGMDLITVLPIPSAEVFGWHPEFGNGYGSTDVNTEINPGESYFVDVIFGDDSTDTGWLIVYVYNQDGYPIEEAHVSVWNDEFDIDSMTDENGHTIVELPEGYYEVDAWAEGFESEYYGGVEILSNEETSIDFMLEPDQDFELTNFEITINGGDVADIEPWESATVTIEFDDTGAEPYAGMLAIFYDANFNDVLDPEDDINFFEYDGEGPAVLLVDNMDPDENPDIGIIELTLGGQDDDGPGGFFGLIQNTSWLYTSYDPDMDDFGNSTARINVTGFESDYSISGDTEPPTPNMMVFAILADSMGILMPHFTLTQEDGSYHVDVADTGFYLIGIELDFDLMFYGNLYASPSFQFVEVHGHATLIDFEIAEYDARVYGHVTNPEGEGIWDAEVNFSYHDDDENVHIESDAWTDETGYYELWLQEGYDYDANVWADGYMDHHNDNVYIEGGDFEYSVTLEPWNNELGAIEGTVKDQDGNGIEDAWVTAWGNSGEWSTNTDPDGYYSLTEVPPGEYDMGAEADGYPGSDGTTGVEVYPNETTYIDFYLEQEDQGSGTIIVLVMDYTDSANVVFISPYYPTVEMNTGTQGSVTAMLSPGPWTVVAFDNDSTTWADYWDGGVIHVEDGSAEVIELFLYPREEYGWVNMYVRMETNDNDEPIMEAPVTVQDSDGNIHFEGYTNVWGGIHEALPPGDDYLARVETEYGYQEQYFSVFVNEWQQLDFVFGGNDENIMVNSGFEEGSDENANNPNGWEIYPGELNHLVFQTGWEMLGNSEYTFEAFDGNHSLLIWGLYSGYPNENNVFQTWFDGSLEPGTEFHVDAHMMTDQYNSLSQGGNSAFLFAYYFAPDWGYIGHETSAPFDGTYPDNDWHHFAFNGIVPEGTHIVQIGVRFVQPDDNSHGTVYVDNLRAHIDQGEEPPPDPALFGTWMMAPEANAVMAGPNPFDGSYYSNTEEDVDTLWCYFDDLYVFDEDGFHNDHDDQTYLEGWQAADSVQGCGFPVYPHDGSSNPAGYDFGGGTLTLHGIGAYIGLPRAANGFELTSPDQAPESITYEVSFSYDGEIMYLVIESAIEGAGVFWTFKLIREDDEGDFTYLGEFDGSEYYLSDYVDTWTNANEWVQSLGEPEVHLVTIGSQEENDFIKEATGGGIWLGLTDQYEEGNWQWVTGEDLVYTNWLEGEPNNSNEEEHFAEMLDDGTWNDLHEEALVFVVEVVDDFFDEDESATILGIYDVPDDQGGRVYVEFSRSVHDTDSLRTAEMYTVERLDGDTWVGLNSVSAYGNDDYVVEATTLADSTSENDAIMTYRIIAAMEEGNFASDPQSGYSVDNIAPGAPTGVVAAISEGVVYLEWAHSDANDLDYYAVYRSTDPEFLPGEESMIGSSEGSDFSDDVEELGDYYYAVTAYDIHENESDPSEFVNVTLLSLEDIRGLPEVFTLHQNYPNPFNPITQIQYALPTDANVSIVIYDLMGRQIRTLVNQQVSAGYHSVMWNATSEMGSPVSAGVYIYTITANDFRDVKKMILLK